jgi:hypothetical protein
MSSNRPAAHDRLLKRRRVVAFARHLRDADDLAIVQDRHAPWMLTLDDHGRFHDAEREKAPGVASSNPTGASELDKNRSIAEATGVGVTQRLRPLAKLSGIQRSRSARARASGRDDLCDALEATVHGRRSRFSAAHHSHLAY